MDNKKLVMYVFAVLILFGLVLNFGSAGIINTSTTSVNVVTGSVYGIDNWTKGGENTTVTITINFASGEQYDKISNITIFTPANILLSDYTSVANKTNISDVDGSLLDLWSCELNATENEANDYLNGITCQNVSAGGEINTSTNSSVTINLNVYYNTTGTEETVDWKIEVSNSSGGVETDSLTVSTNIDNLAPRLIELNVSDGYTALVNSTTSVFSLIPQAILEEGFDTIDNGTLRADGSLLVTATFEDAGAGTRTLFNDYVYLYYNTTTDGNASAGDSLEVLMKTNDETSPYKFTGTISNLVENNITTFVFLANDSFNNDVYQNYTDLDASEPFVVLTNTTNVPILSLVNISNGAYEIITFSGASYLKSGTHTIVVSASGRDLYGQRDFSADGVMFYYNTTDTISNLSVEVNGYIADTDKDELPVFLDNYSTVTDTTYFNGTFDIASGNNTNVVYFAVIANSTNGTYYTLATGEYIIDDAAPTVTVTEPSDTSITTGHSITYSCEGSDGGVKGLTYKWTLTKPGGDTDTSVTTSSATFTGTSQTGRAGTYNVKCTVTDALGNFGYSSLYEFTASSGTGGSSGSGGSGGSSTTISKFDVDLSTTPSGSVSGNVGKIKSFSFDGATKHTVTFKEITETSATITIASTPIDVTLNIGETKEVDINSDGINDVEVTLDQVKFGTTAEITIKKLEAGAKIIAEEEKKVAEAATEEIVKVVKGSGWLWITLLIIVVVVGIGYYVFKKK